MTEEILEREKDPANYCAEAYSGTASCQEKDCLKIRCKRCRRHLCPVCLKHYILMIYAEDEDGCTLLCVKKSRKDNTPFFPVERKSNGTV